jgi:hypothetical protein
MGGDLARELFSEIIDVFVEMLVQVRLLYPIRLLTGGEPSRVGLI